MERLERLAGRLAHGVGQLDAQNAEGVLETASLVTELTEELASRASRECQDSRRGSAPAPGDVRTALVVDPSRRDRARLRDMLLKLGYLVLEAETGASALAACEDCEGPLDVMLTGLFLDDMSGREAAERASVLKPEMHVIYISSCSGEVLRSGLLASEGLTLDKPITSEALVQKLSPAARTEYV